MANLTKEQRAQKEAEEKAEMEAKIRAEIEAQIRAEYEEKSAKGASAWWEWKAVQPAFAMPELPVWFR